MSRRERSTLIAGLYPSFEARATYTRNQYASEATFSPAPGEPPITVVLFPRDLLEATFTARVPLIDVSRWLRLGASSATVRSSEARELATGRELDRRVAIAFFRALGAQATVAAAERSLELTRELLQVTESQVKAGIAMDIDIARMEADLADRSQALAEARQLEVLSLWELHTLSGLYPSVLAPPAGSGISGASDDVEGHDSVDSGDRIREGESEADPTGAAFDGKLEDWLALAPDLPQVVAAREAAAAARREVAAAWATYVPTLTATAEQRFTNAPGFVGRDSVYALGLELALPVDLVGVQTARTAQARAEASQVRAELVLRDARTALHDAWTRTRTAAERSRAATRQSRASSLAAQLVRARYDAGAAGSFETIDASRSAFIAEAGMIREETELALARVLLRLTAGLAPDAPPPGPRPRPEPESRTDSSPVLKSASISLSAPSSSPPPVSAPDSTSVSPSDSTSISDSGPNSILVPVAKSFPDPRPPSPPPSQPRKRRHHGR